MPSPFKKGKRWLRLCIPAGKTSGLVTVSHGPEECRLDRGLRRGVLSAGRGCPVSQPCPLPAASAGSEGTDYVTGKQYPRGQAVARSGDDACRGQMFPNV